MVMPMFLFTKGLTPDPINLQAFFAGSDTASGDAYGASSALSNDGNVLAVGAPTDDNATGVDAGAVYLHKRTAGNWAQTTKLTSPVVGQFGFVVSLSDDGKTLAVGLNLPAATAVYVYTETAGVWSLQATITPSVTAGTFGSDLKLSASGNTLVVGAAGQTFGAQAAAGCIFIFDRSAGVWTETARLGQSAPVANKNFGGAVAISGDGTKIIATADTDIEYFELNGTWAIQGSGITASGWGTTMLMPLTRCALTQTADLAFVSIGSQVSVFARNGTNWVLLVNTSGGSATSRGRWATSISRDGLYCVTDARSGGGVEGFCEVQRRNGDTWPSIYTPPGHTGITTEGGHGTSISGDGKTIAFGRQVGGTGGEMNIYTSSDNL